FFSFHDTATTEIYTLSLHDALPIYDLDIPSLEVLEESLADFPGALVLVTHDRFLLDRVSTGILALDGKGGARPFADLAQWERAGDRKSTRLNSSHVAISYAVFCLKK